MCQVRHASEEMTVLLQRLESSGCQFQRNGTWYSAQDARAHLQKKLDYIKPKLASSTTEEVIDLIAAKSSVSGVSYQVKCHGSQSLESAKWLLAQLQALRQFGSK